MKASSDELVERPEEPQFHPRPPDGGDGRHTTVM